MFDPRESAAQKTQRIARDLHELRKLAWLVVRNRYGREPRRVDGGRRGKARLITHTFYTEPADDLEADRAVREAEPRRSSALRRDQ